MSDGQAQEGSFDAMMTRLARLRTVKASALALTVLLAGQTLPALAQDSGAEARLRRIEAEVRALQRKVFPGADGKLFTPEITAAPATPTATAGVPATTPVSDLLTRMDAIETQIARLTAQSEQNTNRIAQLEARIAPAAATGAVDAAATVAPATTTPAPAPAAQSNLSAMTGGASTPQPASTTAPAATTAKPAAATGPSAQRLAAVRAIEKPQTQDAGDDEYTYGFRLWDAKFYPEAAQQLKLFVDKYPRHSRISFGRNLLGRALLDDGKPREAASWFLQNYQAEKTGARAADSLLYLAVSMKQLNDTNRACIALAEFSETYAAEAAGRLKSVYDGTRTGLKCNK